MHVALQALDFSFGQHKKPMLTWPASKEWPWWIKSISGEFRFVDEDTTRDDVNSHHIKAISALQSPEYVSAIFGDNDGNDLYMYNVHYIDVATRNPEVYNGILSFYSGDKYDKNRTVIAPGPDYEFALRGISFRTVGTDHQIGTMGVSAYRTSPRFISNLWNVFASLGIGDISNPYHVVVQYTWVPSENVAAVTTVNGTRNREIVPISADYPVIQGFYFQNPSNRSVQNFSIRFENNMLGVRFQDSNKVKDMHWSVSYLELIP